MGKGIPVNNLTEPIRLTLPNIEPQLSESDAQIRVRRSANTPGISEKKIYKSYCTMMVNIHLLPVEVNESVIILQIKPQLGAYNNTNDLKDISLFAFMNKGKFVVLLSQRQQTIACVLEKVFSALSSLLL